MVGITFENESPVLSVGPISQGAKCKSVLLREINLSPQHSRYEGLSLALNFQNPKPKSDPGSSTICWTNDIGQFCVKVILTLFHMIGVFLKRPHSEEFANYFLFGCADDNMFRNKMQWAMESWLFPFCEYIEEDTWGL